jgi:hypothetical protein
MEISSELLRPAYKYFTCLSKKYEIPYLTCTIPTTSKRRPPSVVVISNTLVLLASTAHAHDLSVVSVVVKNK